MISIRVSVISTLFALLTVEVTINRSVLGDEIASDADGVGLGGIGERSQSGSEGDGETSIAQAVLQVLKEIVAVLGNRVSTECGDKDVSVPAHALRAGSVFGNHVLHEGRVPVSVADRVGHVEGEHEREANLSGGGISVGDAVNLPGAAGRSAVRGDPIERESVNANVLGRLHVRLPLILVVGVRIVQQEVRDDSTGGGKLDAKGRQQDEAQHLGQHDEGELQRN